MSAAAGASTYPSRCVLENVPKVHFYQGGPRCPEDVPFPSCLRAALEFMGQNLGCRHTTVRQPAWPFDCAYAYILGVSGAASRLLWHPAQWDGANGDMALMAEDAHEPFRRAFEAVGYACEILDRPPERDSEALFRQRIVDSIAGQGLPVIAFGVIGPPECCLVSGYDESGDVLIGWNFFQDFPECNADVEFEPNGQFRKRGWYPATPGLILIGAKRERPPMKELGRRSLAWILQVTRTPQVGSRRSGLAAYTAWAEALLRDDQFASDDIALLRERYMVHYDAVGILAEGRWYGALFLAQLASNVFDRAAEELFHAAACYAAEHDLMWQVWRLAGGNGVSDAHVRKLAEPETRRQIAAVILQARDQDAQATAHIERALARVK